MNFELWVGAAGALAVALASGLGERRRRNRRDLDRIGLVSWPLIQLLAMLAAVICVSLALNLRQG